MHVTVIHNPGAGAGSPGKDELIAVLEKVGHAVSYHSILAGDFEHSLADPGELVVACGGDGTVAKVARRMVGRGIPIAIVPLGTANNIATSVGIRGGWKRYLRRIESAQPRELDVAVARAPWGSARFVESAGLGLIAELLRYADEVDDDTDNEDVAEALDEGAKQLRRVLKNMQPRHWAVEADGEDISGEYILVAALNIPRVGPRVVFAPDADPGDGRLDLVLVGEQDRKALRDHLKALRKGDPTPERWPSRRVSRVKLVWDFELGHLDDERWPKEADGVGDSGDESEVELAIVTPPIDVLVPADDDPDE